MASMLHEKTIAFAIILKRALIFPCIKWCDSDRIVFLLRGHLSRMADFRDSADAILVSLAVPYLRD